MTSMTERKFVALNVTFNPNNTALYIKANEEKEKTETIDLREMKDIHFGNSKKEINYCNIASQGYHVKADTVIDLSKS